MFSLSRLLYGSRASFKDLKIGHFGKPFTPSHSKEENAQERRARVQLQPMRLCRHLSPRRGLLRRRGAGGQGRAPYVGVWRATRWCQCPDVRMLRLSALCLCFQHRRQLHYSVALISCPYSLLLCAHRWGSCRISFLLDLHRVLSCDDFSQPSPHVSPLCTIWSTGATLIYMISHPDSRGTARLAKVEGPGMEITNWSDSDWCPSTLSNN